MPNPLVEDDYHQLPPQEFLILLPSSFQVGVEALVHHLVEEGAEVGRSQVVEVEEVGRIQEVGVVLVGQIQVGEVEVAVSQILVEEVVGEVV